MSYPARAEGLVNSTTRMYPYIWSRGPLASSPYPVWVFHEWHVFSDWPSSAFLSSSASPLHTSGCSFPLFNCLLVDTYNNHWPWSSEYTLVDLLYIWRGKHSFFRAPIHSHMHMHTDDQPTTIYTHTPTCTHTRAHTYTELISYNCVTLCKNLGSFE